MNFIPLNELAEEKILAYFTELDVLGAEAAKIAKRGYIPLVNRLYKQQDEEVAAPKGIRSLSAPVVPDILGKKKRGRPSLKHLGNNKADAVPETQLGKTVE